MPAYRLNLPPSNNRLRRPALISPVWCSGCGRTVHGRADIREVSTGEAKAFRRHAHAHLPKKLTEGPVEVLATYYLEGLSSDGPNRGKALFDAMQDFLFHNDCQIGELHEVYLFADAKHAPGVVFEVNPADPTVHAERARRLAKSVIQQRANERAQSKLFSENSAEPTDGGAAPRVDSRAKPSDAPGPAPAFAGARRAVLPESMQQRINRLARPASYPAPDDEPKGSA